MRLSDWFILRNQDGRLTWHTTDDRPQWLYDAVYAMHDGELPNDWRWELAAETAIAIDEDDGDFDLHQFSDDYPCDSTVGLLRWYENIPSRIGYADELLQDGIEYSSLFDLLRAGQATCILRAAQTFYDEWSKHQ